MYSYDQKPSTHFSDVAVKLTQQIKSSEYSVLVGRNNCGKSFILKQLTQEIGPNSSYLGPARYQNFNLLGFFTPNRNRKNQKWQDFINIYNNQQQNMDNSPVNLQEAIAELSDEKRDLLKQIVKTLLDIDLEIKYTIEDNSMSQKYISAGGHNISYTSSGFRLIMTMLTSLLNDTYDTYLIDEPELGISPEAQGLLADFLFDRSHRAKYFPHIKTIIFATHSTIFLDRINISNNYTISKDGDVINIKQVSNTFEFNDIHFFLLGNRFETLYLPSAIVLVEGKCDHKFIDRVLSLRCANKSISIIPANTDSRIKEILLIVKSLFSDIQKSPYRDRIFIVLDSVHTSGLKNQLVAMGIPDKHIVVWEKNGIEYYYPPSVVDRIFGVGNEIEIIGDHVIRNGISYSKGELVERVVSYIDSATEMHPDFCAKLLSVIIEKTGE